ncbi:MAG: hypothetical protein J6J44_14395 [Lachnospiraceae bacterium]|nr:hypothetical protein [Lachnospiraceae bacterium]MBP3595707.1 hypothetical protein [Lachnospiraceae bacterium]
MISLKLLEMNRFMGKLLKGENFDGFLLKEGFLRTGMEYRFQGRVFPEYFDTEEQEKHKEEYTYWGEVKPFVFELVKGKRTPLAFSFTLLLAKNQTTELLVRRSVNVGEDSPSLFLQVRFEHGEGHIVTGTARNIFTLDKSLEEAWDTEVKHIFKAMELAVEEE